MVDYSKFDEVYDKEPLNIKPLSISTTSAAPSEGADASSQLSGTQDATLASSNNNNSSASEGAAEMDSTLYLSKDEINKILKRYPIGNGTSTDGSVGSTPETWQVIIRPVNGWTKRPELKEKGKQKKKEIDVCRPYVIFIIMLLPSNGLIYQKMSTPADEYPSPASIALAISEAIQNPKIGSQRRPIKLAFTNAGLRNKIALTMAQIQIESIVLSEAEGVNELVQAVSTHLLVKGYLQRNESSMRPGLLPSPSVTTEMCSKFYADCDIVYDIAPWNIYNGNFIFKFTSLESIQGIIPANESVYVSFVGFDETGKSSTKEGSAVDDDREVGMAVFFSLLDLRIRMGQEKIVDKLISKKTCSYTGKTAEELGIQGLKATKPRRFDIRSGMELLYSSQEAIQNHWSSVKSYAKPYTELEEGIKKEKEYWMDTECTILFVDPTVVPFDDLDMLENNKSWWKHLNRIPLPLQLKNGEPCRPDARHLLWLDYVCVISTLLSKRAEIGERVIAKGNSGLKIGVNSHPFVLTCIYDGDSRGDDVESGAAATASISTPIPPSDQKSEKDAKSAKNI